MVAAAEIVCPEGKQKFKKISLSRNTVARRIETIAQNLDDQLESRVKSFVSFSVCLDESTDVTDVAQLVRGVSSDLSLTEEVLDLVPLLDTTTAANILDALVTSVEAMGLC